MKISELSRSTPEEQGISSTAIQAFIEAVAQDQLELHSLMMLRHGHVVAEGWWSPYTSDQPHLLYSLSKSFTSTAVGLAVAEGLLSVDDCVLSFFPDEAPAQVGEHIAAMRVHHLLSMATGHEEDTFGRVRMQVGKQWVKGILALPPEHAPGSIFAYNNGATYLLAAIVQKLTGLMLLDYLRPRLLAPLGIDDATWNVSPEGIHLGFSGLYITTESIARFGQLYLQKGLWHGERLIPEAWVERATSPHVDNAAPGKDVDWCQGYGYQFWRCQHGAYRGDGAFGQFCIVMPAQDAVLAMTSGASSMQGILDRVWEHLLPAFGESALVQNQAEQERLARKLAALSIPPVQGQPSSPLIEAVSSRTYRFDTNKQEVEDAEEPRIASLSLAFHQEQALLTLVDDQGDTHQISCGYGVWQPGTTAFYDSQEVPVVVSGAWSAPDTFEVKVCYVRTPHCATMTFRFVEDEVRYDVRWNVMFGATERPQLVGRLEK